MFFSGAFILPIFSIPFTLAISCLHSSLTAFLCTFENSCIRMLLKRFVFRLWYFLPEQHPLTLIQSCRTSPLFSQHIQKKVVSVRLLVAFTVFLQCSTSCGPGVQPLEVECVKINSSGETNSVDPKECTDIKPPTHVACNVENPCDGQSDDEE